MSSQNTKYLDSLSLAIEHYSKKKQIQIINTVRFDKIESDVKTYKTLADQAIRFSLDIGDSLLLADSYASKAYVTDNKESIKLYLDAIRIYERLHLFGKSGDMYTRLGWQLKRRDYEKAIMYYRKGMRTLEKHQGNIPIDPVYDNYGVMLGMKKDWDSALYYHEKSLKLKKQLNDSVGIPFGYAHLANVYLNQKKYDRALKYLDSSLVIRKKRHDTYGITDAYLYYGDLYFSKKDYENAVDYYKKGYKLALENHYFPLKKYAAEYLYKSNDFLGDYKAALKYNLIFNQLKDSVLNIETNNKISELEIQFQTESKEKEILSQRADLAEKELDISQKNTQIIGLCVLALVLALLGYLVYNQQKLKNSQLKKESELKEALIKIEAQNKLQEQRLEISRELHDNIGAQLTFIISSLDNLKYGFSLPDKLGEKLNAISEFTTATIYELRDTIWAMNKNEISFDDLHSRISNFIDKASAASETIKFNFTANPELQKSLKLSSVKGMNVYRIIQEALNNALKYASANTIQVFLEIDGNKGFQISIQDDGKGFDLNAIEYGNGLNNMKKRAEEINAKFKIESELGKGTTVKVINIPNA
ncbi:tetratricopeptide repeat-containing sensor histidine kinase [Hanstruepera flava]|uniref:tetratricopeptide repeat-containing sensor histidine kinase n=1 Tax=Hanstruepera flava TaxID=2930218 RepID=UPI002028F156|nr:sensor histidine kinase [Hanstruepera flava]